MSRRIPARDFGSSRVRTPLVFPGQRVGLMGGSFNPPHEGHRIVAETAMKRLQLDQVWWLVTPGNPLKANAGLALQGERMAAVGRLARGPRMKITGFEADLRTAYTAQTLAFLKRRYPGVHFVWVMGADNLAGFDRWQNWRGIADTVPMAVVDRPGWRMKALSGLAAQRYGLGRVSETLAGALPLRPAPSWTYLTSRLSPLSSTALRAANRPKERLTKKI